MIRALAAGVGGQMLDRGRQAVRRVMRRVVLCGVGFVLLAVGVGFGLQAVFTALALEIGTIAAAAVIGGAFAAAGLLCLAVALWSRDKPVAPAPAAVPPPTLDPETEALAALARAAAGRGRSVPAPALLGIAALLGYSLSRQRRR